MKNLRIVFASVAVLFLVVLAVSPMKTISGNGEAIRQPIISI